MIKDNFTITPESGSNNGKITVVASPNTIESERRSTVNVSGGGINKSVSLIQRAYIDIYTKWAKYVKSDWDLTEDWVFPDIYLDATESTLKKAPIDKAWVFDGNTAEMSPATPGTYIDSCNMQQRPISGAASGKTYEYRVDGQVIKTNGCWFWTYLCPNNIAMGKKITITTNGTYDGELRINHINVHTATGSPNLQELKDYCSQLGWKLEKEDTDGNEVVHFTPIESTGVRVPIYIRLAKNPKDRDVSDCLNLILK